MKQKRKQAECLRLLRQQLRHQRGQKNGFLREIATGGIRPARVRPTFREGGVNGVQRSLEPTRKLFALGDAKWDAGLADLVLGTDESLTHGCRRGEERRGDCLCIQPEHDLQHQRRADADVDRWMRAGEHQRETMIRDLRADCRVQPFRKELQLGSSCFAAAASSVDVDDLAASDGQQPRFRIRRTAVVRPIDKRRSERLRQGVLGSSHVPRARREKGDELAVAATRDCVCSATRLLVAFAAAHALIPQIGRTSTTPWPAAGQRAAHEIAASRSATSMMK